MSFGDRPALVFSIIGILTLSLVVALVLLGLKFLSKRRRLKRLGAAIWLDENGKVLSVDLEGKRVTDSDLKHLHGLTSLERLWLNETQVGDAGLAHLQGLTKLKELALYRTQVSDAGLDHLRNLTNLKSLVLEDTRVTDHGVLGLQETLPDCKIRR